MADLHIHWTPPRQPATRFYADCPGRTPARMLFRWSGHKLAWCFNCRKRRRLRHLDIVEQAYYDPMFFCRVGGCAKKVT